MNLLVAVMNATVQKIQDKKQLYWKFARSGVLLRFTLKLMFQHKANKRYQFPIRHNVDKKKQQQLEQKDLIMNLVQRYQDERNQSEDEGFGHCQILSMKEEILGELEKLNL